MPGRALRIHAADADLMTGGVTECDHRSDQPPCLQAGSELAGVAPAVDQILQALLDRHVTCRVGLGAALRFAVPMTVRRLLGHQRSGCGEEPAEGFGGRTGLDISGFQYGERPSAQLIAHRGEKRLTGAVVHVGGLSCETGDGSDLRHARIGALGKHPDRGRYQGDTVALDFYPLTATPYL